MMKLRLDKCIVDRNLAPTRSLAQHHIFSGHVTVDGQLVTKAGFPVTSHQLIAIAGELPSFVSRGGEKLSAALDRWNIQVAGRSCLDVGISTGGFTDCMLQRGAARIVGVDSGHGQLAVALQNDPRLRLLEHTNARHLTASLLPEIIDFFTMDVAFIAASLVLPAVIRSAFRSPTSASEDFPREAIVLVKPQFEAGREFVGKHGIVRSAAAHQYAVSRVRETVCEHGARETAVMDSPITGGDGNHEFLLYARF